MVSSHIANQIKANPPLVGDNTLHVVGVISNYARYHSRYRLFRDWYAKMQSTPHVKVYVVEAAYGDRAHEITTAGDPTHLQLRTSSEIWVKENLVNLGVRHLLPRDWRYVAWVDCDVEFRNDQWAAEAMQQAQHNAVLQPWQHCLDLGPLGDVGCTHTSFGRLSSIGQRIQIKPEEPYQYGHSGFAWVARRDFWEATGGLLDFAILGSADHHMAWACCGNVDASIHGGMSAGFKQKCHDWQQRALPVSMRRVGYAPGRIEDEFHGSKTRRGYRSRWDILVDAGFDPIKDLRYDHQGLIQLVGKPELEAAIRAYNRSRAEDSTDAA